MGLLWVGEAAAKPPTIARTMMATEMARIQADRAENVRALERGLQILRLVNRSGGIRPGEIARMLGLARPTVYRLLETLEELHYVQRSASDSRFRVTRQAGGLGDGYDTSVAVGHAAGPVLAELSQRIRWPLDLVTYDDAAMVVQETTHARSPFSIDRGVIGRRQPMLRSSGGRAYLAFCSEEERRTIIAHLQGVDDPDDRPFLEDAALSRMIRETAQRGLGVGSCGKYNVRTASISAPIRNGKTVLGCLTLIWIKTALSLDAAIDDHAEALLEAARAIAAQCAAPVRGVGEPRGMPAADRACPADGRFHVG